MLYPYSNTATPPGAAMTVTANASASRPHPLAPIFENIPAELEALGQWVVFRYEWSVTTNDWTKIPRIPRTGANAKTNDPATWGTFLEARTAVEHGEYEGLGFVFTDADPYTGIDLDNCRTPLSAAIDQWAQEVINSLPGHWEVSPQGKGVKGIVKALMAPGSRHKRVLARMVPDGTRSLAATNKAPSIEIYDTLRYFTITGHLVPRSNHRD